MYWSTSYVVPFLTSANTSSTHLIHSHSLANHSFQKVLPICWLSGDGFQSTLRSDGSVKFRFKICRKNAWLYWQKPEREVKGGCVRLTFIQNRGKLSQKGERYFYLTGGPYRSKSISYTSMNNQHNEQAFVALRGVAENFNFNLDFLINQRGR